MKMPDRLVIVHGFLSTPRHHWFRWLKAQFENQGTQVILPRMPAPRTPKPEQWLSHLTHSVPTPTCHTWFIAHSLGCIPLMHYLASLNEGRVVGGAILVAGFAEPVPLLPELNDFTRQRIDYRQLKENVHHLITLRSMNDDMVPPDFTLSLSRELSAELYSFPAAGHFRDRDGFCQFPALLKVLHKYL
ncbi:RBBP9/YdeN family alpha/beta hydrolase [Sodalis sp. RH22]|uniref:RBBP9/YdeN family alpha/beta hydrolase n=1 Tax=unclassified Sodalis (in: enterobacteria) TaxID=2636512 RepID=UPI0039B6C291